MDKIKFEVCAENINAVKAAIKAGADRVELCRDLALDGLTPDEDTIRRAVALARGSSRRFEVMVLVRPRSGGFIYNHEEKRTMTDSIRTICGLGADGVVTGSLAPDMTVDADWMKEAVELAHSNGLSATFHRAFDHVADPAEALGTLIDIGVDRILTSGGRPDVISGIDELAALNRMADGRISIMPGGGVKSSNISRLHSVVGASEYHGSCRRTSADGNCSTDLQEIKLIVDILNR